MLNEFLIYILKSAICLAVLYSIYWLFLRRDTFFKSNRFYLLSSVILSFILPLFKIPVFYDNPEVAYVVVLEAVNVTSENIQTNLSNNRNLYQSIFMVYLTGASIFTIRYVFQLLQLFILIRKHEIIKKDTLKIVKLPKRYSPFSYFSFVFLNEDNLNDRELDKIINHEKIHIKQNHSLDLLMLEFFTIFQWFNPFMWMYKASIKSIHEFLADEGLLSTGLNKINYQNLLLNQTVGIQINGLTNNLNQSLIKKRFIMMTKMKSKQNAKLKYLISLPITAILVISFAISLNQNVFANTKLNQPEETMNTIAEESLAQMTDEEKEKTFIVVEDMPGFPGGEEALLKFLRENVKYPEQAKSKGIQGRVYVTFIVETDGSLSDIRLIRGVHKSLNEEALRVVKMMPKWVVGKQRGKKVRVQFNLPIRFALNEKTAKEKDNFKMNFFIADEIPEVEGGYDEIINEMKKKRKAEIKYVHEYADREVFNENLTGIVVEEMPRIIGYENLKQFVKANISYPEEAKKNKIKGVVAISYVVEKDGSVSDIKVRRGLGYGCDEEAIRIARLMKFKPGKHKGEIVRVPYQLMVGFTLE